MRMGRSDSGMTLSAGVCNPPSLQKQVQNSRSTYDHTLPDTSADDNHHDIVSGL